jgi:tripartite-type tricarboxylate transporter receptor subunit TctC
MYSCRKDLVALVLVGSAVPLGAISASSEAVYPERPVTLVIGVPPGGETDAVARVLSSHMTEELGHRVIVEYRPGASANIAAEFVARTTPDGYTIFLGGRPQTIHKVMYGHLKYDFARDLTPIAQAATVPYVLVTGKHAPITTVEDVVGLAKADPGGVTCASSGVGTTSHLLCELFQQETDIQLQHVAYRGSAQALIDVIGGRIDVQVAAVPAALEYIKAGTLRPLAVMSNLRATSMPEVPTMEEAGVQGLALDAWYGLMAPAGTPPHIIARLNRSVNSALMNPHVREALAHLGATPPLRPNTPAALGDLITDETDRWTRILEVRNIRPLH